MAKEFKSGFVSILGRSNAGKSTLLNALVSGEVAMVSPKPQTTRHHIKGILNREDSQIIFSDTPGIFTPRRKIDRLMVQSAYSAIKDADLLLLVVEPFSAKKKSYINDYDKNIVKKFSSASCPKFLVVNKVDKYPEGNILFTIENYNKNYSFDQTVPVSALKGKGLSGLLDLIVEAVPAGPRYFPEDMLTDQGEDFLVSELIRQQLILLTRQEVPYSAAVVVEGIEEGETLVKIFARIVVNSDAHKKIIIGAKGGMIKEIGSRARPRMEKVFGKKVFLELMVKVKPGWGEDHGFLARENLV
ncbi:MAG: GTPase Era [bacterium]